ncbi:hypothetical protein L1887_11199 [Cichorium endivia]|nr:hypothetical protein L1887_11199 [Cichorium endivia]
MGAIGSGRPAVGAGHWICEAIRWFLWAFVLSDPLTRVRSAVWLYGSGESSHYTMGDITYVDSPYYFA